MRVPTTSIAYTDLTGTHAHHLSRHHSEPAEVDIFALFAARPDWMADAACRGMDVTNWYPSRGDSHSGSTAEARAICARCPVRAECLNHALSTPREHFGIWGGLSERQRRFIGREKVA